MVQYTYSSFNTEIQQIQRQYYNIEARRDRGDSITRAHRIKQVIQEKNH